MFGWIPRDEAFFELFTKAAHNMIEGSRLLQEMMEKYGNPLEHAGRIKQIEHVGDSITHDIVRKLNRTFITPIDREDIHALASALDDILDEIDEVADRFVIFKVPNSTPVAVRLAQILHEASIALSAGIEQLGKGQMDINECSVRVNSLENEADRLSRDAISKLFDEEKDPMAVIKWKEIYENFEAGTDRCEDAANILERIVLKHI